VRLRSEAFANGGVARADGAAILIFLDGLPKRPSATSLRFGDSGSAFCLKLMVNKAKSALSWGRSTSGRGIGT
jgi:hypothetical protein